MQANSVRRQRGTEDTNRLRHHVLRPLCTGHNHRSRAISQGSHVEERDRFARLDALTQCRQRGANRANGLARPREFESMLDIAGELVVVLC